MDEPRDGQMRMSTKTDSAASKRMNDADEQSTQDGSKMTRILSGTRFAAVSTALTIALMMAFAVHAGSVNKNIKVAAGEQSGGESTVNGNISVGAGATISGGLSTVNGTIRVDDDVRLDDAETVNGALRLGDGVTASSLGTVNGSIRVGERGNIEDGIEAVNGRIEAGGGTVVGSGISNVNGEIELSGAEVSGDVSTVNGDVLLNDGTAVLGDVVIEKPNRWNWGNKQSRKPKVIVGPGSRVDGYVIAEREIDLYLSESAQVGGVRGEVSIDDAIRFSGDRP